MSAGQRPPSGLPAISPLGGRSDGAPPFANRLRRRTSETPKLPISPLVGEMSGRTERGAKDHRDDYVSPSTPAPDPRSDHPHPRCRPRA
ncbi:hypothetical protein EN833_29700 [Mesorhizobium sp. M4B.F.Ca.ET.190.01.1.1]|nr:MAG: hypothetical protein EOS47_25280 [Mesorhizobium sp.]TGQ29187.1 hypothetical protein EN857_29700 [Mesorhizobium sp. M4B.F.Ca.ET.214.01.1.1]TGQ56382.1 hypothetical protein EN854_29565 [Mesorhizobium sp. M4B.F.Ca.ET.211.01.1.1]TGR01202.1 hypothetical protein EN843_29695 [Mesorhizobium sp. M4B.F.Ca.ET.200.01.1.1]TGS13018.1 hypothetical protein EN833_29700 [Mesorhizobium sp. M4B.F.Ca.ET.190.01.1.1]TGT25397.1 hypothetical protein EN815_29680 [Mesorhizobium sp. M4B.F.Ca.ET.172.01.1.1]TGU2972